MKKRLFAVLAALALVASACGGDADTCSAIADDALDLVQGLIDQVDEMSIEQLAELDANFTSDFEADIDKLVNDADEANCSDDQMTELFRGKVDTLTSDSEFGQLFIDQFTSDDLFSE